MMHTSWQGSTTEMRGGPACPLGKRPLELTGPEDNPIDDAVFPPKASHQGLRGSFSCGCSL